jgi:integrase/recombinase XerD
MTEPGLPALVQGFFTRRLMQQRQASSHTIASYRDSFRLLLRFAQQRLGVAPQTPDVRAARCAADRCVPRRLADRPRHQRHQPQPSADGDSLVLSLSAFEMPACAAQIQRVLAIPNKRCTRKQIGLPHPRGDRRTAGRARPVRVRSGQA